jgi:protease I
MEQKLSGKKVTTLVADGFEQFELTEPKKALERVGAVAHIVSPNKDRVKGWNRTEWGDAFRVDLVLDRADPEDYDAQLLPGGVMNPDKLRRNERALQFVRAFFNSDKPVAAICHGPWTLIDAGVVKGRRLTSYEYVQADLKNAGAEWVNEEVAIDQGRGASRKPDDIQAFNRKMIEEFAEDKRQLRAMEQKGG